MGFFDFLKQIPTSSELKGEVGERLTSAIAHIDIPEAIVMRDVLIDGYEDMTSQIDLLLIGEKGVYVAEVKMYTDAKIYGDGKKNKWYYYRAGKKYEFYSPIKQNKNHIKYLKELLKDFGDMPYFSLIVLLCDNFKISNINENLDEPDTVILSSVLKLRKAMKLISKGKPRIITRDKQKEICEYIKKHQHEGKEVRKEHKEKVSKINYKFSQEVYDIVKSIPAGRVVTYGQVAEYLGNKAYARTVGNILHDNPDSANIPCHRVVNSKGQVAENYAFGGAEGHRKRLEDEGIVFEANGTIDLKKYSTSIERK